MVLINMKRELVIYGAGGLGREILSLINRDYKNELQYNFIEYKKAESKLSIHRVYPRAWMYFPV